MGDISSFFVFLCACTCNQLFRLMHYLSYHIATSCIIKRENARGGTRDLYHAPSFCTAAKPRQKISDILNARVPLYANINDFLISVPTNETHLKFNIGHFLNTRVYK